MEFGKALLDLLTNQLFSNSANAVIAILLVFVIVLLAIIHFGAKWVRSAMRDKAEDMRAKDEQLYAAMLSLQDLIKEDNANDKTLSDTFHQINVSLEGIKILLTHTKG